MRLVIFLLKCVVGLLASIGFLVVAGAVVMAVLIQRAEPWRAALGPDIPEQSVLTLDLAGGIVDAPSESPLARLTRGPVLVLRDTIETLEAAGHDPRVQGLVARLGIGQLGIAQVQELRRAIAGFRAQGKFALAFAESFGEAGDGTLHYYLASAFDEVWLQPSGSFDVVGFAMELPFLREALDDLGIQPRLDQREEYKGVMNTFTDRRLPAPQRQNLQQVVDSWMTQIVADVAADRGREAGAVQEAIDTAPHAAEAALDLALVDRLGYWDEIANEALERAGEQSDFMGLRAYAGASEPLPTPGPTVALIYGLGPVVLSGGGNPAFGETVMGADVVAEAIAEAVEDPDIAAIVLRVDSPGGSYVASDAIWREVRRAREGGKPLIVSMGNVAASGGYFVAAAAQTIVALPGTLTGSIGVVSGKLVLSDLWDKLGINWDRVQAGEAAGFWSMNRDFSEEEWARLQETLDRIYRDFTSKVAAGRGLTPEEVAAAAKGQVWTGADARAIGLVDELGGLDRALELAAEAAGAPGERVRVRVLPKPRDPFEALVEDMLAARMEPGVTRALARELARLAAAVRPLTEAAERLGANGAQLRAPLPAPAVD